MQKTTRFIPKSWNKAGFLAFKMKCFQQLIVICEAVHHVAILSDFHNDERLFCTSPRFQQAAWIDEERVVDFFCTEHMGMAEAADVGAELLCSVCKRQDG